MALFNRNDIDEFVYIAKQERFLTLQERDDAAEVASAAREQREANTIIGRIKGYLPGGPPVQSANMQPTGVTGIPDPEDVLILSATKTYSKEYKGSTTDHVVDSKKTISDHYMKHGSDLVFEGVVSPQLMFVLFDEGAGDTAASTPAEYVKGVAEFLTSEDDNLCNIHFPDGFGEYNCVITSFKFSRDAKVSNGYRVTIRAKQIQTAQGAITIISAKNLTDPAAALGTISSIKDIGSSEVLNAGLGTLGASALERGTEFIGNILNPVIDLGKSMAKQVLGGFLK